MTFSTVDSTALPGTPEVQVVSTPTAEGNLYVTTLLDSGGKPVAIATNLVTNPSGSAIVSNITGSTGAQGGAVAVTGGTSTTAANAGGAVAITGGTPGATGIGGAVTMTGAAGLGGAAGGATSVTAGAGQGTGAGAIAKIVGGASGAGATGNGGAAQVTGGAAASTDGSGGAVTIASGASAGTGAGASITLTPGAVSTGAAGGVFVRGLEVLSQGAPTALTTSATLTAAQVLAGILTANQGGGATAAYQLPTGSALQTALPAAFAAGDAFIFSLINVSTVAAEDVTITTNTDWTLVGSMAVQSNDADTSKSSGRFMARKTADHVFTLYRIS